MSYVNAILKHGNEVTQATGHVASLKLPIGCGNLLPLVEILESVYGKGLVVIEEPIGWLKVITPETTPPLAGRDGKDGVR